MIRVMGIDPGLATGGVGVIAWDENTREATVLSSAVWKSGPEESLAARLGRLADWIDARLDDCRPDVVAIEEVFHAHNPRTALMMAHARGVFLAAAARRGIPIHGYAARLVKQSVAGFGGADKAQVGEMVRRLLRLADVPKPDHVADAFALALTHAQTIGGQRGRLEALRREAAGGVGGGVGGGRGSAPAPGGAGGGVPAEELTARRRSRGKSREAWRHWKGPDGEPGLGASPPRPPRPKRTQ
jgi:crossover junction endodeoxyribonuclease RuvC